MSGQSRLASLASWCSAQPFLAALAMAGALVIIAVLVQNVGDPSTGQRRRTTNVVLLLLAGVVLALCGSVFLINIGRWGYLLALLPGAAIARHAVYMRFIRRRAMVAHVAIPSGIRALQAQGDGEDVSLERRDPDLMRVFARARQMHDLDFAVDTLAVRFGIPALLTTFIGIGVFELLRTTGLSAAASPSSNLAVVPWAMVHAARFGAAGAMVYVLLYLGQRAFRNDITSGAALWSAIVLAVGPVLAAALALIWSGDGAAAGGGAGTATVSPWTHDALYFVAGMSPRHVASAVEEAVRRLWLSRTPAMQVQSRLQPVAQLRGVTTAIEDRLAEEGIVDVQGMAMADPLKLFRATSFDKRQILSWMDEAMLMTWLPEHWPVLQKVGMTGAIDLMAHATIREAPLRKVLADSAKLEPAAVDAVVLAGRLLSEDAQLRLVWALYQFDEENLDQPATTPEFVDVLGGTGAPASLAMPGVGWLLGALAFAVCALVADDVKVPVVQVVPPLLVLMASFVIAFAVRWPGTRKVRHFLPLVAFALGLGALILAWGKLAPVLALLWPARALLLEAAATCLGIFLVGMVTSRVGRDLTIEFPFGAPADTHLLVDGLPVPIARAEGELTTCRVTGRRLPVVVRSQGAAQQFWLDARGQAAPRLSLPLRGVVVVRVEPPEAGPLRLWVDEIEADGSPMFLWPRGAVYTIRAQAPGFLPEEEQIVVSRAETYSLTIVLRPLPPPPSPPPAGSEPVQRAPQTIVVDAGAIQIGGNQPDAPAPGKTEQPPKQPDVPRQADAPVHNPDGEEV